MNFNLINVIVFGAGAILVYSAVKNVHPKDVITSAFDGETAKPRDDKPQGQPYTPPNDPPTVVPAVYPSV